MRFAADFLPVMITVDNWTERTLTSLTLVRIQVPQPVCICYCLSREPIFSAKVLPRLGDVTARKRRAQLAQLRSPGSVLGLTPWHVSQLLAGKRAHPPFGQEFLKALRGMIAVAIVAGLCELFWPRAFV